MTELTELQKKNILRQNNQEANAITRECIETALVKLLEEKDFADISITDITKKAGVSRTAYYRNYESKEDILTQYMQSIYREISDVLKQYNAITDTLKSWCALLDVTEKLAPRYKILLKAGFGERMIQEYLKSMNASVDNMTPELYYSNAYWAGAISFVLSEWLRNDMNIPKKQLAEIGSNMMVNGINTTLAYGNQCK